MKLLYQPERLSYQHAAVVSAITEAMRERIVMKGIPQQKTVVFSHWSDPRLFDVPISGGGRGVSPRTRWSRSGARYSILDSTGALWFCILETRA